MNGVRREYGLIRLLMAATLVLFMAACSSNSGVKNDRDMYKQQAADLAAELETVKAQLATVTGERDQAQSDLADANGQVTTLTGQVNDLNGEIESLTTMRDDLRTMRDNLQTEVDTLTAQGVTNGMTISGLNGQITDLNDQITDLGGRIADLMTEKDGVQGRLDAADTRISDLEGMLGTANTKIATLEQQIADAAAEQAAKDAEDAREERIATEDALRDVITTADNRADAAGTGRGFAATDVTVERDAAGKVTAEIGEDYEGETTAGSGDWNSVTMTDGDNTVLLYTDIDAPADKAFNDQYDRATRDNILDNDARVKLAMAAAFPTGSTESKTFGGESGNPGSFDGSFDGVSGTYECTAGGGTCVLTTDADGELAMAGDWRFTPNSNLATVKDPDMTHVHFGWWLKKTKDGPEDVEVFTGATADHAVGGAAIQAIEGTASYSGPAAGKFVTKTFEAGVQTDANAGHFTATATLTAKFGEADEMGSIEGEVGHFTLNDTLSAAWTVTLGSVDLTNNDSFEAGVTDVNFGGADNEGVGTWTGSFYGAGADAGDHPDAVAGKFDAATPGASLLGAFGATLVE